MSSGEQPYNSLGQILAEGGEIALGLAMIRGASPGSLLVLFNRRFEPLRDDDRDALISLSQRMVESGATIQSTDISGQLPLDLVPLNESLFGGATEGRRSLFTVEVEFPGAESRVQIRLPFADIPTQDEIREAALGRAQDIAGQYPGKFGLPPDWQPSAGAVYVLLPERAF